MKPIVDEGLINRMCLLSKLGLNQEQKERAGRDLAQILDYVDCLEQVDVSGVEPLYQVLPAENVFRKDEVRDGAENMDLFLDAPEQREGYVVVPRTIGEG